jgi:glycerol-3-phosphate responsive antiterminator
MRLTAHFTLAEFTRSESAKRHGVSNQPTPEHIQNIKILCERVLEPIRMKFGPLILSSGYRSKVLNHYIGGSLKSQHCEGKAADIDMDGVDGVTNKEIFEYIKNELEFDQLINEFNYSWIHVSYNLGKNRKQVLDALKVNNKTVYAIHRD